MTHKIKVRYKRFDFYDLDLTEGSFDKYDSFFDFDIIISEKDLPIPKFRWRYKKYIWKTVGLYAGENILSIYIPESSFLFNIELLYRKDLLNPNDIIEVLRTETALYRKIDESLSF